MNGPRSFNRTKPLLSVVGLTAAGKSSLCLWLAEQLTAEKKAKGVVLISADSRQVYQGMEVLTGADIPDEFSVQKSDKLPYQFYKHQSQPFSLHGVSIIYPSQDWSAAHFRNMAIELIKYSWKYDYLPMVVGGTGFYHQQLFNNDPDIYVKPNADIRSEADGMNTNKLQQWLQTVSKSRWQEMNQSDRSNPRRLIRAIEVSLALQDPSPRIKTRPKFNQPDHYLQLGLKLPLKKLEPKIKQRVLHRFTHGAIQEVEELQRLDLDPSHPAMTAAGVKPISRYLKGELTGQQVITNWTRQELQYAKRQLTWWKKYGQADWFQPDKKDWRQAVKQAAVSGLSL